MYQNINGLSLQNRYILVLLIYFTLLFINVYYASLSWSEIRDSVGWITLLKQDNEFKIRHFVQFFPQTLFFYFILSIVRWNFTQRVIGAFLGLLFIGVLSEVLQLLSPQRIFSWIDIVWNLWAVSFALSCPILAHLFKKRSPFWPTSLVLYFVFFSLISLFFHEIIGFPFMGDDYKLLSANNNPNILNFSYWLDVFSSPTNGTQYRPMSYFALFYWVSLLIEESSFAYGFVSISFLSLISTSVFWLLYYKNQNEVFSFLMASTISLSPIYHKHIVSARNMGKYSLVLAIFLTSLVWVRNLRELKASNVAALTIMSAILITLHEGAVVFPFIMLIWVRCLQKKKYPPKFYGY